MQETEKAFSKAFLPNVVLLENIKNIYRKISYAALRTGRNPFNIKLITITKTVDFERIKATIDLGLRIFGENRVQEAQKKITECKVQIPDCKVEWHLVGHLQKNKAKTAAQLFELIHSVDSIGLAQEINKQAEKAGKIQRVLIQVKLSEEETKHGVSKKGLVDLIKNVSEMKNLKLDGLMTMPPFFDKPELSRPFFRELKELRDSAELLGYRLPELSMGMTNDFEIAVEEGATMVRVGTGIFGERG
jgi:pyridoxal phosphate enzyme (YggS family)